MVDPFIAPPLLRSSRPLIHLVPASGWIFFVPTSGAATVDDGRRASEDSPSTRPLLRRLGGETDIHHTMSPFTSFPAPWRISAGRQHRTRQIRPRPMLFTFGFLLHSTAPPHPVGCCSAFRTSNSRLCPWRKILRRRTVADKRTLQIR